MSVGLARLLRITEAGLCYFLLKTFSTSPFQGQYPKQAVSTKKTPTTIDSGFQNPIREKPKGINATPSIIRMTRSILGTFFVRAIKYLQCMNESVSTQNSPLTVQFSCAQCSIRKGEKAIEIAPSRGWSEFFTGTLRAQPNQVQGALFVLRFLKQNRNRISETVSNHNVQEAMSTEISHSNAPGAVPNRVSSSKFKLTMPLIQ